MAGLASAAPSDIPSDFGSSRSCAASPNGPVPADVDRTEARRLAAVRRYDVIDDTDDSTFDAITTVATRAVGVPIAVVSIVDDDQIQFLSHPGLDIETVDRAPGLCASAILHDAPWIVTDAAIDPRATDNPLVVGDPHVRFYAGVPLTSSDGLRLGALSVMDVQPRRITIDEVQIVRDLATVVMNELESRLATRSTIDDERQLRLESQEIAHTLQRIALPPSLPQPPGLTISAEYLPATSAQVGGDWYDAFELDDDRIAITIGDVCGHDLPAAAVMGQLRNAIRAYAFHGFDPSQTLHALDDLLQHVAPGRFATVAHFVVDVRSSSYSAANAAHLPPMRIDDDGGCTLIDWPAAPPVGSGFDSRYPLIHGRFDVGERLLLYTDGLVERRGETIDDGIDRLRRAIEMSEDDPLRAALTLTSRRELDDDTALIMLSRST